MARQQAPPHHKVFISYRMREHLEFIPQIADALRAGGIQVAVDIEVLPRTHESGVSALLPRATGVNFSLWTNILDCDTVLVIVPSKEADPETNWKDVTDIFMVAAMRAPHINSIPPQILTGVVFDQLVTAWYKRFYGFDIEKNASETWQEWEIRVTQFFGLSFVRVYLAHSSSDVPVPREHGARIIHIETLDEDIQHSLIPYLYSLPVKRNKPQPLPEHRRLFKVSRMVKSGFGIYDNVVTSPRRALKHIKGWRRSR
jgi:hypothetical protein